MIGLVQRVAWGRVEVDGQTVGAIGPGLLVLVGVHVADTPADAHWLADRLCGLRIFTDAAGKMNLAVWQPGPGREPADPSAPPQAGPGVLLVPNFTLCASTGKGHRPGFDNAMRPPQAADLFNAVVEGVRAGLAARAAEPQALACTVATGRFGADMAVSLLNDGPVTLILDSSTRPGGRA
ncbi:MAG: D-aminoacyl-tRNA deacylase [Planctomycetaceae bacterium]|jgi:D-tyrosyl-tRNA(Tyr) deacylase|nr:D-tyrosyl-tRNA(Tyr) deacylase [Phycisphaerales bacterium]MCE2652049.1 D-aminoacyl-tRNA deacylase [Planctomycetaceae bacterium]